MLSYRVKKYLGQVLAVVFLISSHLSYALPFTIGPKSGFPLPTVVLTGGIATAFYTVKNNTGSIRNASYVKYLPPHVSQVVTDLSVPDLCGASFTLQPRGLSNDSCTLELRVEAGVNSHDRNPRHHLFVCNAGGLTCAGTLYPLDVTELSGFIPRFISAGTFTLSGSFPALLVNSSSANNWVYISTTNSPGAFISANLFSASCADTTCSTVGQYNVGSGFQPAIIASNNSGIAWHFVSPSDAPGIMTTSNLSSVFCRGSTCAAAGQYNIGGGEQPAVIVSLDNAVSWHFVTPGSAPGGILDANLNTVLCPDNRCIAVGQYNAGSGYQPAIIISNDNGATWNYLVASNPPGVFTSTALSTLDCTGNTCAAAGQYNLGSGTQPAIIVSLNGGTWSFITPSNSPGTIRSTTLRTVRCVGNVCIAAGQYSLGGATLPALIVSNDTAQSWHFVSPDNIPGAITNALLTAADCDGSTCAAVGQYDLGAGTQPAIVVSTDAGVSWRYIAPSNSPGTIISSILNSVNCTGNTCVAVGQYDTGNGPQPATIVSLDSGASWHFVSTGNLPNGITSANLFSSECNGIICIAVGQYNNGSGFQPLLLSSIDSGVTWQFVNPANPPGVISFAKLNKVTSLP